MKKYINSFFALFVLVLVGTAFASCTDEAYDTNPYNKSGVNILAFGPAPTERTHEIRITGTNLNAVDKVVFPADATVAEAAVVRSEFNKADAENIYVNIPDATVPGHIKLVAGKDTITSEGIITFEEPIEVTEVTPVKGLNAGDNVTIKGDYVYNIASVTFTAGVTVPAEEFVSTSRREIVVTVPLAAETGTISMTDGADWKFEYETPLEILSATYHSISATTVEFGDQITITGTNLHTVESVMFPGGVKSEFTVSGDHKSLTTSVPAECKSGSVTLVLFSGAAISTDEIAVPTIAVTSISKDKDICEGDEITITGENLNRVVSVSLPGVGELAADKYTNDGTHITFTVPEGFVDGVITLKQNANISVDVPVAIRKLAGVIWQGKVDLVGWSSFGVFSWSPEYKTFQEAVTGPGEFTIHFVQTGGAPVFNFKLGDWGTAFQNPSITPEADGVFKPAEGVEDITVTLTQEEVDKMFGGDNGMGFVIWGENIQVQYVKYVAAGAEAIVWEGTEDMGSWSNQPYIGADTAPEFAEAGVQEGWKVRFYGEATGQWQFQVFEGHWGPNYAKWANFSPDDNDGTVQIHDGVEGEVCLVLPLTQAMIDAAYTQQWWGGIFVVQGANFVLKKVTVCPL